MPVIGTGTFNPNDGFNVPRSYLGFFATHSDWTLESHIDNSFVFNDFAFYNDRIFINLRPSFWPWNSNSYNLDEIIIDTYYYALPSLIPLPFDFTLKYIPPIPSRPSGLSLLNASFSSSLQYFTLPPVNVPYWLP